MMGCMAVKVKIEIPPGSQAVPSHMEASQRTLSVWGMRLSRVGKLMAGLPMYKREMSWACWGAAMQCVSEKATQSPEGAPMTSPGCAA